MDLYVEGKVLVGLEAGEQFIIYLHLHFRQFHVVKKGTFTVLL